MTYRFVDHTSELRLELEAQTEASVLAEAAVAIGDLLGDSPPERVEVVREVQVEAGDRAALLAAWLDELVFLAETDGFVPTRVDRIQIDGGAARGVVSGYHGSPPHLIKGVTYNELELSFDGRLWHGRVVLDV